MSATMMSGARKIVGNRPPTSTLILHGFVLAVIGVDATVLITGAVVSPDVFHEVGWAIIAWILVVAAIDAASLPFESGQQLGLDMPLLLAAGYLFGPLVAGSIAFVAYVDPRELRGKISLARALFNRAQTSLSVMAAAAVFGLLVSHDAPWPFAFVGALLAVGVDCLVNYGSVVSVLCLDQRVKPLDGLSRLFFGSAHEFVLTYMSFGLLSLVLAETYDSVGVWGLAIVAIPVFLARQAFAGHQRITTATRRVETQAEAIRALSSSMADERRDERLSLAAGLHDEVLPPLYKVHLMGQVLRQELASGRLLELEDDLPELLVATEAASESMRSLIRNLRASSLGTSGLAETLKLLVEYLERESPIRINLRCADVTATPLVQLLAYQVAREAIRNALRHSGASEVNVSIAEDEGSLRVSVRDDGIGFDPRNVDAANHFGLLLMRERVEMVGGVLHVETSPGAGVQIVAKLPSRATYE